ncbi:MAG: hypothetical protein H8E84_08310 [Flavobacteriales bacterium]|nr:hypothetical protein [Flavobacteriales bacterium]
MKKKLFYLLVVGAIFSLSSCSESHKCYGCGDSFTGKGYSGAFRSCVKVKSGQGSYCSSSCCYNSPGGS